MIFSAFDFFQQKNNIIIIISIRISCLRRSCANGSAASTVGDPNSGSVAGIPRRGRSDDMAMRRCDVSHEKNHVLFDLFVEKPGSKSDQITGKLRFMTLKKLLIYVHMKYVMIFDMS